MTMHRTEFEKTGKASPNDLRFCDHCGCATHETRGVEVNGFPQRLCENCFRIETERANGTLGSIPICKRTEGGAWAMGCTKFACGCTAHKCLDVNGVAPWLEHCALHAAAPALYEALREVLAEYEDYAEGWEPDSAAHAICRKARAALALVDGDDDA